jgi:RND family efflux transporter MFP subunit
MVRPVSGRGGGYLMNNVEVSRGSKHGSFGPLIGGVVVLLVAAGAAFWGISTRARTLTVVRQETEQFGIATVSVAMPERGAMEDEIVLPGSIKAFVEAPIYARTNGYLRAWHADIGTRVQAGQLLAEVDTPEVDQQLLQARADLATAIANAKLAQSTAERYRDLIKTDSVSKQDLDNVNGSLEAKEAIVDSAGANVKRLEDLQAFSRIEAPFAGIITARNVDVGALIGVNNPIELFHIAATDRLRVFANVPEAYSRAAQPGLTADITLKEFPGRRFTGTLARTAESIDVASRTLLTEVDVNNPKGELLAGSYAEVHLKLPSAAPTFNLPVAAVIFKTDGVQVATVDSGSRVNIVPVVLGRDFGNTVEVVTGLTGAESVIINPPDSLRVGQTVRIAQTEPRRP